jgi:capsular exopolysaccharide synthesis family protein
VTFKQVLDVLWQRKWLVIIVVLVAMLAAAGYLRLQVQSYTSTIVARTSSTVSTAAGGGDLGGVQVDFDPSSITSPKILNKVAALTGQSRAALAAGVTYQLAMDPTQATNTTTVTITSVAATPSLAVKTAQETVSVYNDYLQKQITGVVTTLKARQAAANKLAVQYEAEVRSNPANSIASANLTSAISNFQTLNNEIETISDAGTPTTVTAAATPGAPVGPGMYLVLGAALAAGLIAGIGLALIRDQFDNRLRGESEIELLTGLPPLGELVLDKSLRRRKDVMPAANRQQTPLGEGMRSLRTAMQVLLPRQKAVVVISSVDPGDGKSFVSANIALAWSRIGKKVILVGGDLRRPSLATYFAEAAEGPGLSEILRQPAGTTAVKIATQVDAHLAATEFPGLRILPAGYDADDSSDLLATSVLKKVVDALRQRADIVIIDSPPAMALVDASLLASNADGVMVIAAVNKTDRVSLVATVDLLRQNGARLLGVVANRSRRGRPRTYSSYYVQSDTAKTKSALITQLDEPPVARTKGKGSSSEPATATE